MKLRVISILTPTLVLCALSACSSGPAPPEKGSPAWLWAAARETFNSGDWMKSTEHLSHLTNGSSEFAEKARPWELLVLGGMADGYIQLADAYELGARANKSNPSQFRKSVSEYRNQANRIALGCAEKFAKFQKESKDDTVVMEFAFPKGSAAMPIQLGRVQTGIAIQPGEAADLQSKMVSRSIVMAVCDAVDASGDPAKGADAFKSGSASVPRAKFEAGLAGELYKFSQLYTPMKLDIPDRVKYFLTAAAGAAEKSPDGKEKKDLLAKIDAAKKKVK
jgi:hypothetical protein